MKTRKEKKGGATKGQEVAFGYFELASLPKRPKIIALVEKTICGLVNTSSPHHITG